MATYIIDNREAPLNFAPKTTEERIIQNVKNLLRMKKGEIPFDRERGFDTAAMEYTMPMAEAKIRQEVDRVLAWESRARNVGAIAILQENGETIIQVTINIGEGGNNTNGHK